MTKRTLITIIVAVVLVILAGVWYLLSSTSGIPGQQPTSPNENPFGPPAGNNNFPGTTQQGITELQTNIGTNISVPDLTAGKAGFPIGTHQFYFLTSNQETQGEGAQFDIVYGTDSSISVGLFKEPLGQARLAAEAELRKIIPLSDAQLCTLKITVAVPYQVNQFYAAQNLGLSFCPGSVALPK